MIKELDLLRAFACLSILLLHTTTWIGMPEITWIDYGRVLLCFATPTFIILSIIILTHKYPDKVPQHFWNHRLQFILIPFFVFALVDALLSTYLFEDGTVFQNYFNNVIFGEFVGWFILVIFQFYLLYWLMVKFKWSPFLVLSFGVLLSLIHYSTIFDYRLRHLFTGWLIYFAVGYLIGTYYKRLAKTLKKYRYYTILACLLSASLIFIHISQGNFITNSSRFDLIPFVVSMTCLFIAWGQIIPYYPIIKLISKYSFAIYLLHWPLLDLFASWFIRNIDNLFVLIVLLMLWVLISSIAITKILSLLPFGKWIIGKIRTQ